MGRDPRVVDMEVLLLEYVIVIPGDGPAFVIKQPEQ